MFLYLFIASAVLLFAWLPFYIDFRFMKIPYTPQKMICSTLFLLGGIFAGAYTSMTNWYFRLIIIAFVLSWIGDLALAKNSKGARFVIGLVSFFGAHVCYIFAMYFGGKILFGSGKILTVGEIAVALSIFAVLVALKFILKLKFDGLGAAVAVYALTICFMFSKALFLGISAMTSGTENGAVIFAVLLSAAVLFMFSDAVLVLILFDNRYSQLTEGLNIGTYYTAQMLFALSIILVNSSALRIS